MNLTVYVGGDGYSGVIGSDGKFSTKRSAGNRLLSDLARPM